MRRLQADPLSLSNLKHRTYVTIMHVTLQAASRMQSPPWARCRSAPSLASQRLRACTGQASFPSLELIGQLCFKYMSHFRPLHPSHHACIAPCVHHTFAIMFTYMPYYLTNLQGMSGSVVDIHGALFTPTWTRLTATVYGAFRIVELADSVNWQPGQLVAIATSLWKDECRNQVSVWAFRSKQPERTS